MKNLNKNPLAWLVLAVIIGWLFVENGDTDTFIVLISAVILAKQIEILNKHEK